MAMMGTHNMEECEYVCLCMAEGNWLISNLGVHSDGVAHEQWRIHTHTHFAFQMIDIGEKCRNYKMVIG